MWQPYSIQTTSTLMISGGWYTVRLLVLDDRHYFLSHQGFFYMAISPPPFLKFACCTYTYMYIIIYTAAAHIDTSVNIFLQHWRACSTFVRSRACFSIDLPPFQKFLETSLLLSYCTAETLSLWNFHQYDKGHYIFYVFISTKKIATKILPMRAGGSW